MAQLRISKETHEMLRQLARQEGTSMQGVLDKALDEYQKNRFFHSLGAAFGALKADVESWDEEQRERGLWANTLSDNIEPDEVWTEDGDVVGSR
jgi:gas vesicle protein